jgi:uncharacterized membrane protein (DUF2068 family)
MKPRKLTPTLYLIIGLKSLKCLLAIAVAFGLYRIQNQNLPNLLDRILMALHQDPAKHFFVQLAQKLNTITPTHIHHVMLGALIYAAMLALQAIGLIFGIRWIIWFTIIEAGALLPWEIMEIVQKPTIIKFVVVLINLGIILYLLKNRKKLAH